MTQVEVIDLGGGESTWINIPSHREYNPAPYNGREAMESHYRPPAPTKPYTAGMDAFRVLERQRATRVLQQEQIEAQREKTAGVIPPEHDLYVKIRIRVCFALIFLGAVFALGFMFDN